MRKTIFWILYLGLTVLVGLALFAEVTRSQVVVNGMGGGTIRWGASETIDLMQEAIDRGEPIILGEGHYTSAGAMPLYAVDHIPGSCIHPDALFHFHEPQSLAAMLVMCAPLQGEERMSAVRSYSLWFRPELREWYMETVVGDTPDCGFTTLTGADLARFGYPICEGEGEE